MPESTPSYALGGVGVLTRERVDVDVARDARARVAEPFAKHVDAHAGVDGDCRRGVSQAVKAVRATPAPGNKPQRDPGLTYNVVGGSKPVEGVVTWALAADHAGTYGSKVRAIRRNPS